MTISLIPKNENFSPNVDEDGYEIPLQIFEQQKLKSVVESASRPLPAAPTTASGYDKLNFSKVEKSAELALRPLPAAPIDVDSTASGYDKLNFSKAEKSAKLALRPLPAAPIDVDSTASGYDKLNFSKVEKSAELALRPLPAAPIDVDSTASGYDKLNFSKVEKSAESALRPLPAAPIDIDSTASEDDKLNFLKIKNSAELASRPLPPIPGQAFSPIDSEFKAPIYEELDFSKNKKFLVQLFKNLSNILKAIEKQIRKILDHKVKADVSVEKSYIKPPPTLISEEQKNINIAKLLFEIKGMMDDMHLHMESLKRMKHNLEEEIERSAKVYELKKGEELGVKFTQPAWAKQLNEEQKPQDISKFLVKMQGSLDGMQALTESLKSMESNLGEQIEKSTKVYESEKGEELGVKLTEPMAMAKQQLNDLTRLQEIMGLKSKSTLSIHKPIDKPFKLATSQEKTTMINSHSFYKPVYKFQNVTYDNVNHASKITR